jgi:hypothetical protein
MRFSSDRLRADWRREVAGAVLSRLGGPAAVPAGAALGPGEVPATAQDVPVTALCPADAAEQAITRGRAG